MIHSYDKTPWPVKRERDFTIYYRGMRVQVRATFRGLLELLRILDQRRPA